MQQMPAVDMDAEAMQEVPNNNTTFEKLDAQDLAELLCKALNQRLGLGPAKNNDTDESTVQNDFELVVN